MNFKLKFLVKAKKRRKGATFLLANFLLHSSTKSECELRFVFLVVAIGWHQKLNLPHTVPPIVVFFFAKL